MKRIKVCFLLMVNIVFWCWLPLYSQESKPDDLSNPFELSIDELLEKVVTVSAVSKYEQGLKEAPASVIVVTARQIQERGYRDLPDLLKDIPGFDIIDNAGRFGEFYTIRGIEGNDRFLVLIDGHKINPASGTFISIGNSIPIHFARQVEIIYGPASSIYGADAFAGIINISMMSSQTNEVRLQANTGSLKQSDLSLYSYLKNDKGITFTTAARLFHSDGPDFTGKGYPEYDNTLQYYKSPQVAEFNQPIKDHNLFLKLTNKDFTVAYFQQHFNEGNFTGTQPGIYLFSKENLWEMTSHLLWLTFERKISAKKILEIDLSYIHHVQSPETSFVKWQNPGVSKHAYSQYMTGKDKTYRGVITLTQNVSRKIRWISGVEFESTRSIPPYANDEVLGYSAKYDGEDATLIDDTLTINEQLYACFGQLTYQPSKIIDIILGGRYDYSSRYKGTFNPRLGIILRPFSNTTVKIHYGTAFQAPSLFYQFEQFGTANLAFRSTNEIKNDEDPTWELKNQELKTYELSLYQSIGNRVKLNVAFYHNDFKNVIERVIYDDTGYTWNKYYHTFTNGQRNENIGSREVIGFDVRLNAAMSKNVDGYIYYSYTDGKINSVDPKIPIPRVSQHKSWFGATFRNIFKHLTISPRFKWVGEIDTAITNTLYFGEPQPGYTSLDLSLSMENLVKNVRFFAYFGNLLDERIQHAGLFEQGTAYASYIPQMGIHFHVGMEFTIK